MFRKYKRRNDLFWFPSTASNIESTKKLASYIRLYEDKVTIENQQIPLISLVKSQCKDFLSM